MPSLPALTPGTPRLGLWHEPCATSGGWACAMYTLTPDGPEPIGWMSGCTTCDGED